MVIDIPTKDDFYSSADDMVNEAWEKISHLAYQFYEADITNQPDYTKGNSDELLFSLENYWAHSRPKLISALTLVIQSVEFRLKGLIAEVSPYLLLSSSSKSIPKADENGIRSFAQFHSVDAQDLIKVYETFSGKKLSSKFRSWFEELRVLRNRFMHTVDNKSDINPEIIFKSIVYAHNELNENDPHWILHRYKYKAKHSGDGIEINNDEESGEVFEMLQTHYELAGAVYVCSRSSAKEIFQFDKNQNGHLCKSCVSTMSKSEYFDSKHLDYCIETVQKNKRSGVYECVFCNVKYQEIPKSIWEDEDDEEI